MKSSYLPCYTRRPLSLGLLTLICCAPLAAQTWNGMGSDAFWSTSANWSGSIAPANNGTANVTFSGTPARTLSDLGGAFSVSTVSFASDLPAMTLQGGTLGLTSVNTSGVTALNFNSPSLQTLSVNLSLDAASGNTQSITLTNGSALLTGDINLNSKRLAISGSGEIALSGVISGAANTLGAITLATDFTGKATLSGNSTFTRKVSVQGGTLIVAASTQINVAGALGKSSAAVELGHATNNADATILTGGPVNIAQNIQLLSSTGTGIMTVGGNTAQASSYSGNVILGTAASTARGVQLTAVTGGHVTFSGNILNGGAIGDDNDTVTKTGSGTVIISGTGNTYTGTTTVKQGTLLFDGAFSAAGAGITVKSAATLGGTGTIDRAITVESTGTLQAGDGSFSQTLTINSAVNLQAGSTVGIALGAGGVHSTLARTGGTWTFAGNQSFLFIDAGAEAGTYHGIVSGLIADPGVAGWVIANAGWTGEFIYNAGSVDLVLTTTSIPEPSTAAMLTGMFACGIAIWRRNRRTR